MFFFDDNAIVRRLKKYPILSEFSEFTLGRLVNQSEVITLEEEQVLFRYNDTCDSVYYLIDGHLEGYSSDTFTKKVASLRAGDMVGEIGILTCESRGMAVKATRETQLLKISREVFLKFFQKDSDLLLSLGQMMGKRVRYMIDGLKDNHYNYKNVAIIPLSPDVIFERMNAVFQLHSDYDQVKLYSKGDFEASELEVVHFFHECEENPGVNIFFGTYGNENWNKMVLSHVDYIYFITNEEGIEHLDKSMLLDIKKRPVDIVIVHANPPPYKNTACVYAQYPFKRHHHIMHNQADYQRLYRYMTGQAIGLVISGGGFRGFAHYGLVKALCEAKIPIDCFAGSSVGAGVAAILSINFDWKFFDEKFHHTMKTLSKTRAWKHFTFPLVSVLSGEIATKVAQQEFGQYKIEDLPLNFFCAVGNLSKGQKDIKKFGELWEWLRASTSIPGILPPLAKDGDVYVDGAVCTNLPVLDMREYLDNAGKIITFDIRIPPLHSQKYVYPPTLTFKTILCHKLGLAKYKFTIPRIIDVVMESSLINQYIYDTQGAKQADIIVAPDTSQINFLSAEGADSLTLPAYELAKQKLEEYKSLYERWII